MKLSISRAALIQWLALGWCCQGLFTCIQAHFTAAVFQVAHDLGVEVAADLGVDGLGRHMPDFSVFAVFRVGHHHVGGQAVAEGAHFARRAAGGGLAGEREGAVAGLACLPSSRWFM
jgi:hypothetical protein